MKALGLIETRGLIAAIESVDTMLKSADVSIFDKTYVGGGLVSVTVTGDVGAVKAAVEAGVAAIKKLDEKLLVSEHVIPRPHEELDSIFGFKNISNFIEESNNVENYIKIQSEDNIEINNDIKNEGQTQSEVKFQNKIEIQYEININHHNEINELKEDLNQGNEVNINNDNLLVESLKDENNINFLEVDLENLQKDDLDKLVKDKGIKKVIEVLDKLKLRNIRIIAKGYTDLDITDEEISKASKKLLITKIKAYYKKL